MSMEMGTMRACLLACVVAFVCALSMATARAQNTDLNIESRIEPFVPKISTTPIGPAVRAPVAQPGTNLVPLIASVGRVAKSNEPATAQPAVAVRPNEFYFLTKGGFNYETNANNSNTNRTGDTIGNLSAILQGAIPVGALDQLDLQLSTTSLRYSKLSENDVDVLAGAASYGHVLSVTQGSTKTNSNKTLLIDAINIGFEAKSVHKREYGALIGNYLTPSIDFTRSNIALSPSLCGKSGDERFCNSAKLTLATRYTGADVTSREYFAVKGSGSARFITTVEGLTLTAAGGVDFKTFTHYTGGRRDVVYSAGAGAEWAVDKKLTLSAGLNFVYQTSNVPAAEWNGFSMGPQAKLTIPLE